jgi:hypothetical protein
MVVDFGKVILKFTWKLKGLVIAKAIAKNKVEEFKLLEISRFAVKLQ